MTEGRDGFIPPFMDIGTLAEHLCISTGTIENWVRMGYLPPSRKVGGKRLWRWQEVERRIAPPDNLIPVSPDEQADRIRNATKAAFKERKGD